MALSEQPKIPAPTNLSPVPDKATKTGIDDYTSGSAAKRVMHLNFGLFKYGTDDQTHAAAILLSLLELLCLMILLTAGPATDQVKDMISFLQHALLLTVGVAIGQSTKSSSKDSKDGAES